ncbi:MAG: endonuclease/exonuclease/phosphatase family protein [Planctomycetota bacterium]
MRHATATLVLLATLLLLVLTMVAPTDQAAAGEARPPSGELRVMTYNIRFGSANDGLDAWPVRRARVVATIKDLAPDILAIQEAESFQVAELLAAFPRYAAIGTHRDDGRLAGEGCITLYDRERFLVTDAGVFWMSETPDTPGSISWDSSLPRIASWARFVDLTTAAPLLVYNTHYDHQGQVARERSSELILHHISAHAGADDTIVVAGDLNADESNTAYLSLIDSTQSPAPLINAFRAVHPQQMAGTYTAFDTTSDGGSRMIDHVLIAGAATILDAGIDRRKIDGRYPSDHFPVWVDLTGSAQQLHPGDAQR